MLVNINHCMCYACAMHAIVCALWTSYNNCIKCTLYIFEVQSLHKRWFQAYTSLTKVHVYSTVVSSLGDWLCVCKIWCSLVSSAGSLSPQTLFCTKSFVHGILVINRWSLTTEIVNSSFYCMLKLSRHSSIC